ncbi:MAG: DNA polymerase III subunit beta [Candidatus Paceibacterota bacterium]
MKTTITKEHLLPALNAATRMSGKNLSLPSLNGILIEAKKNIFSLRATNLDVGIDVRLPAKVEEEGSAVVSGSILGTTIQTARGNINLTLSSGNLKVRSEGTETIIKALPCEDFPTLPKVEDGASLLIDPETLIKGFRSVWYATSSSTIKPELASIFLFSEGGKLHFVATDSFRLAEKVIPLKKAETIESLLIPNRNVAEILHILEQAKGTVEVKYNKNQIAFSFEETYVTSRLVDGSFPDYKAIIPKNFSTEVVLLKQDFFDILKKAGVFANKFNQVYFKVNPKKQEFTVQAENPDVGETTEQLGATLTGEELEISFNQKYLFDALQSIHSDSVSLSFSGLGKPVIVKGISDTSFLYLVMPMNR